MFLMLFVLSIIERRKVTLIESDGIVNETSLNDTINIVTENYNRFMLSHRRILLTLYNMYYVIQK